MIQNGRKKQLIDGTSIRFIEGSSNYSKIFLVGEKLPLVVPKSLCWFESELLANNFLRVHKSHLVNAQFIAYVDNNGNKSQLFLQCGQKIIISRRKKIQLVEDKKAIILEKSKLKTILIV